MCFATPELWGLKSHFSSRVLRPSSWANPQINRHRSPVTGGKSSLLRVHWPGGTTRCEPPKCTGQSGFMCHHGQRKTGQGSEISKGTGSLQVVERRMNTRQTGKFRLGSRTQRGAGAEPAHSPLLGAFPPAVPKSPRAKVSTLRFPSRIRPFHLSLLGKEEGRFKYHSWVFCVFMTSSKSMSPKAVSGWHHFGPLQSYNLMKTLCNMTFGARAQCSVGLLQYGLSMGAGKVSKRTRIPEKSQ